MHDWEQIRNRHGGLVFAVSYRILKHHDMATDCFQDVFLTAFQKFQQKNVENWAALLRWLAVHRALDRLRALQVERNRSARLFSPEEILSKESSPAQKIEFEELLDRLRIEVARLPTNQAEAFWLACVEQVETAEISQQLGTDDGTTRVLIHRARNKLKTWLADLNPQPDKKVEAR